MGACCGKETSDNFQTPGRTLASAPPPQPATSSLPSNKRIIREPARPLGSSKGASGSSGGSSDAADARRKAAEAAEARAQGTKPKGGKLSSQLEAQKKQTRNEVLNEASATERRVREVDESQEVRAHN